MKTNVHRALRSIATTAILAASVAAFAAAPAATSTTKSSSKTTTTRSTTSSKSSASPSKAKDRTAVVCPACNPGATSVCVTSASNPPSVDKATVHLVNRSGVVNWFSKDGGVYKIEGLDATAFTLHAINPNSAGSACHWAATPKAASKIGHSYKYSVVSASGRLDPDVVIDNPPLTGKK